MTEAHLSQDQVKELAEQLALERTELETLIASLGEVTGTKHDCAILDMADSASLYEMQRKAATLITRHEETLREIDAALTRIQVGTYGISERSGEPIAFERLRIIPWARTGADDQVESSGSG